jgi:hypothetical protein
MHKVAIRKPDASRKRSSEVYALAQGKLAQMKIGGPFWKPAFAKAATSRKDEGIT